MLAEIVQVRRLASQDRDGHGEVRRATARALHSFPIDEFPIIRSIVRQVRLHEGSTERTTRLTEEAERPTGSKREQVGALGLRLDRRDETTRVVGRRSHPRDVHQMRRVVTVNRAENSQDRGDAPQCSPSNIIVLGSRAQITERHYSARARHAEPDHRKAQLGHSVGQI